MAAINGYDRKTVMLTQLSLTLGIDQVTPRKHRVHVAPLPKYILGVDIV